MEPEKPLQSDCCRNGCLPCVFDIYEQQLLSWQANQTKKNCNKDTLFRTDLLSKTCFKPFRLIEKRQLRRDVFNLRFQAINNTLTNHSTLEEITGILPYDIGQHLFLRCYHKSINDNTIEKETELTNSGSTTFKEKSESRSADSLELEKGQMVIRAYTPITIAARVNNCYFDIIVKIYKHGVLSDYLNKAMTGDILYWRGPYGAFKYKPNSFSCILMLCMGSGLAPMISITNFILENELDETVVHLMYGVKNINYIILRDDLRKMTKYWNFTSEYFFSEQTEFNNNIKFGEKMRNKRIDNISLAEYIEGKVLKELLVLICGTESFTSHMRSNISDLGVDIITNSYIF